MVQLLFISFVIFSAVSCSGEKDGVDKIRFKECVCGQNRVIACIDDAFGTVTHNSHCKNNNNSKETQIKLTACVVPQACLYRWSSQAWSPCSKSCGKGVRSREIRCIRRGTQGRTFPEVYCQFLQKPNEIGECNVSCGLSLTVGGWSECSTTCGDGYRYKIINCTRKFSNGSIRMSFDCDVKHLVDIVQRCHQRQCGPNATVENEPSVDVALSRQARAKRKAGGAPVIHKGTKNHWVIYWHQSIKADVGDRISAVKGTHITLRCKYEGNPRPRITWVHNGEVLDFIYERDIRVYNYRSESLLKIKFLNRKHIGEYTCLASNANGFALARAWVRMIIQGQATILSERRYLAFKPQDRAVIVTIGTNVTLYDDSQLTLRCPVKVTAPRFFVRWRKRGYISPKTIIRRSGENDNDLTIEKISAVDSGLYSCEARSLFGDDRQSSFVKVLKRTKPKIESTPKDAKEFRLNSQLIATVGDRIFVIVGTRVTIKCPAKGVPKPTISWRRRGMLVTSSANYRNVHSNGDKLIIVKTTENDDDVYTCYATNERGTAQKSSKVVVVPKGSVKPTIIRSSGTRFVDSSGAPKLVIGEKFNVVKGKSMVIQCEAKGSPKPTVVWYLDKKPIHERLKGGFIIDQTGKAILLFDVQHGMEGAYSCVAANYLGKDYATSTLAVIDQSTPFIQAGSRTILDGKSGNQLNIVIGDKLKTSAGRMLIITCPATGIPKPKIIWKRDGRILSSGSEIQILKSGQSLQIHHLKQTDTGTYECYATNPAGVARSFSVLNILARASPVITSSEGSTLADKKSKMAKIFVGTNITVPAGKTLKLECPFDTYEGDQSVVDVAWKIDGNDIAFDGKVQKVKNNLLIHDLQLFDEGLYSCVVSNQHGKDTMHSKVQVSVSPHRLGESRRPEKPIERFSLEKQDLHVVNSGSKVSILTGSTIKIKCLLHGSPRPVLTWWKGKSMLSSGPKYKVKGDTLILKDVKVIDSGEIACRAESRLGTSYSTTSITVLEAKSPVIKKSSGTFVEKRMVGSINGFIGSTLFAVNGVTIRLLCPAEGFPKPTMEWYFNNRLVESNSLLVREKKTDYLIIPRLSSALAGTYNCTASNYYGSDTASIKIASMATTSPRILKSKKNIVSPKNSKEVLIVNIGDFAKVYAGQEVIITCKAHGIPIPDIVWKKNHKNVRRTSDIELLEDGSLRIRNTNKRHSGTYYCFATNNKGADSFSSGLVVLGKDVAMIVPSPIKEIVFANPDANILRASIGSNVTIMEQKTLHLSCEVKGENYRGPVWYKYGVIISQNKRLQINEDGSLVIKDLRVDDAGLYKCQVVTGDGFDEVSSFIKVAVPADRLIIKPKERTREDLNPKTFSDVAESSVGTTLTVLPGKVVSLHCLTQGTMHAKISWFKDGKQVHNDNDHLLKGEQLVLSKLLLPGWYNYSCKAETFLGQAWMTSIIHVVEPVQPTIQADVSQNRVITGDVTKVKIGGLVKARLGSRVDIICKANGIPTPTVKWFKDRQGVIDGGSFILSEKNMMLTVPAVKMDSSGEYTCVASNDIGRADEVTMHMEVYEPLAPNFVLEKTKDKADDSNSYLWYDFLKTLSEANEDGGRNVGLDQGERTVIPEFRAHSPPVVSESDRQIGLIGTDYSVLKGAKLTLQCPVVGTPKPFLIWRKENRIVAENIDKLVLNQMKTMDMGVYSCTAENAFGSRSLKSRVYVIDAQKPKIEGKEGKNNNLKEEYNGNKKIKVVIGTNLMTITGTTIVISCPAVGIPKPRLDFYKDNSPVNVSDDLSVDYKSGLLVLRSTTLQSQGVYTCLAQNRAGKLREETYIRLKEPTKPQFRRDIKKPQYTHSLSRGRGELKISIGKEGVAFVNSIIQVDCSVTGFPVPRLLWKINGKTLLNDNFALNASGFSLKYIASSKETLIFHCTAINAAGTVTGVATVDIIDVTKPAIQRKKSNIKDTKNMSVVISIGENAQVLEGSKLTIRCPVTGAPKPSIMWSSTFGPLLFMPSTKVKQGGKRLEISRVTKRHAVTFKCIANNFVGSDVQMSKITVAETSEPQIVLVHKNITVTDKEEQAVALVGTKINALPGVKIILECHVSGTPKPNVRWEKNSKPYPMAPTSLKNINTWSISLSPVKVRDAGIYTCIAQNPLGQDKGSTIVHVGIRPRIKKLPFLAREVTKLTPSRTTVLVGVNVKIIHGGFLTLRCLAYGKPQPDIRWYKDSSVLILGARMKSRSRNLIEIGPMTLAEEGRYTCAAENQFGKVMSTSIISVIVPPSIDSIHENIVATGDVQKVHIVVGSQLTVQKKLSVSISCPTYGHPRPKVKWIRPDSMFVIDPRIRITGENTLRIDDIESTDSGIYVCTASNLGGSINRTSRIAVGDIPSAEVFPIQQFSAAEQGGDFDVEKHRLIMRRGEEVTLNCLVKGDPVPKISWFKDGAKPKIDGDNYKVIGGRFVIKAAKLSDKGKYCCRSRNVIGETMAEIELIVGDSPKIPLAGAEVKTSTTDTIKARVGSTISAVEGSNILLICDPFGKPQPEIQWFRNGEPVSQFHKIKSGDLLTLFNITLSNSGNYTCVAKNGLGIASSSSFVHIVEPPKIVASTLHSPDRSGNTAIDIHFSSNKDISVVEGTVVKLSCSSQGYPAPKISWKQDHFWIRSEYFEGIQLDERTHSVRRGNDIVDVTTSTLTIKKMDTFQEGMYTCVATNDAGTVSGMVILKTRKKPEGTSVGIWMFSPWKGCGKVCIGAEQSREEREVYCASLSGEKIADTYCDRKQRPSAQRGCQSSICRTGWYTTPWNQCSNSCGDNGVQQRIVTCIFVTSGKKIDQRHCKDVPGRNPERIRQCNRFPCKAEDCTDELVYCALIKKLGYCRTEEFKTKCCFSCQQKRNG